MLPYEQCVGVIGTARQTGCSILGVSGILSIPQRSINHMARKLCLTDRLRLARDENLTYSKEFIGFMLHLSKTRPNLEDIAQLLESDRARLSAIYKTAGIKTKWALEDNHNLTLSASRKAELFCAHDLGIRLVRDCYETRAAGFPYDLILQGYGSVDVKSTILKSEGDKIYASFNVDNFKKTTKYAFLVAFDENREHIKYVFAVPGKQVAGHSTLKLYLSPLSPKYADFLIFDSSTPK